MKNKCSFLYGILLSVFMLPIVVHADSVGGRQDGYENDHNPIINGVYDITLKPGESLKVNDAYCVLGSTAYLTVYHSTAYPLMLEIFGGTAQTSGRDDRWKKLASKDGDYASDYALPFGSDFGFHVTNQSDVTITATVNAHC